VVSPEPLMPHKAAVNRYLEVTGFRAAQQRDCGFSPTGSGIARKMCRIIQSEARYSAV
jgi:hypothetical protein